eukprot:185310-Karenia_brevis.AAC.1
MAADCAHHVDESAGRVLQCWTLLLEIAFNFVLNVLQQTIFVVQLVTPLRLMSIGGLVNMTHPALGKLPCVIVVTSEYSVCCALFAGLVIGSA